jgi:hypothetical protein
MKVNQILSIIVTGLLLGTLTGCIKSTPIEPPKPVSFVTVINSSFSAPAVEMLFNSEKVTPPINPGAFFSRYSTVDPGPLNVEFKKASSDSLVAALPAGDNYDSNSFYTLILYDDTTVGAKAVRIKDEFPSPDDTKTFIRFFHLSADVPRVDLFVENTRLFSDRSSADNVNSSTYNDYQAYNPGSYSLKVKLAGTDSVVASTTYSDLVGNGIYTVFLKGVKGGTDSRAIGVEVVRAAN